MIPLIILPLFLSQPTAALLSESSEINFITNYQHALYISQLPAHAHAIRYLDTTMFPHRQAEWRLADGGMMQNWPTDGKIELKDYSVRYRDGLDLALRSITCSIAGGERVGLRLICLPPSLRTN